ncbi:MAG: hypothetical protein R6U46_04010 [Marinilabilia sp.]
MRTMLFFTLFFIHFASVAGQQIDLLSVDTLDIADDKSWFHPRFSHTGELIALTESNQQGLAVYDMADGQLNHISSEPGAGSKVVFSPDERMVFFTERSYEKSGQRSVLMFYDLPAGVKGYVMEGALFPLMGRSGWRGSLLTWRHARNTLENSDINALMDGYFQYPYVVSDGEAIIYKDRDGKKTLKPFGEDRYLWASLAPGEDQIVAVSGNHGAFVCDVQGANIKEIGLLEAPVWLSDDWIIGMVTEDDGHFITGSFLRAVNVEENNSFRPEVPGDKVMHPSVATGKNLIACHTDGGEILVMKFEWPENSDSKNP